MLVIRDYNTNKLKGKKLDYANKEEGTYMTKNISTKCLKKSKKFIGQVYLIMIINVYSLHHSRENFTKYTCPNMKSYFHIHLLRSI